MVGSRWERRAYRGADRVFAMGEVPFLVEAQRCDVPVLASARASPGRFSPIRRPPSSAGRW